MVFDKTTFMNVVTQLLTNEFVKEAPKKTSHLARSFQSTVRIEGYKIKYTLPKYAGAVMNGSAPHDIMVRDKKILAVPIREWEGKSPNAYGSGKFPMLSKDGQFVMLGKKVRHPGNKPNPFMKDVLHRKLKDIIDQAIEIASR